MTVLARCSGLILRSSIDAGSGLCGTVASRQDLRPHQLGGIFASLFGVSFARDWANATFHRTRFFIGRTAGGFVIAGVGGNATAGAASFAGGGTTDHVG